MPKHSEAIARTTTPWAKNVPAGAASTADEDGAVTSRSLAGSLSSATAGSGAEGLRKLEEIGRQWSQHQEQRPTGSGNTSPRVSERAVPAAAYSAVSSSPAPANILEATFAPPPRASASEASPISPPQVSPPQATLGNLQANGAAPVAEKAPEEKPIWQLDQRVLVPGHDGRQGTVSEGPVGRGLYKVVFEDGFETEWLEYGDILMAEEKQDVDAMPLQIVSLDMKKNLVQVNEENMEIIQRELEKTGADAVSIIAIMGTYRTGKSFLLAFLMRYLRSFQEASAIQEEAAAARKVAFTKAERAALAEGKHEDEAHDAGKAAVKEVTASYGGRDQKFPPPIDKDWRFGLDEELPPPKWVTGADGKAKRISEGCKSLKKHAPDGDHGTGFDWQGGMEKCTEGIWLWSKPFLLPKGKRKIAVLVMDTQGAWDGMMTKEQSATIFGLTSLLASKLIYNMQNMISEEKIDNLDYFTTFAQAACSTMPEGSLSKPFGELDFLVRDWPWYEEGWDRQQCRAQMAEHLEKHLDASKPGARGATVKRLKDIFDTIACTGLAHPGTKVLKPNFHGDISDIESDFLQLLDEFVQDFFGGDFPRPSTPFGGGEITTSTFGSTLSYFVQAFRENKGSAVNLREAFVRVEVYRHRDSFEAQFKKGLDQLAPITSVVDPEWLERKGLIMAEEFKGNFRTRIATYKLQTEAEEIEQFTQDLKILLTRRLQVNRQAVEGANLKLAASPAVGCGAWFLMAHHILCLPAAACFGWMQVKSAAQKHNKEMPAALADPEVLKDAAANLTEFGRNRVRDVQAMQVALSRCSPQNMVSGFNDATQGIGAAGRSALGNSGSHTAQEQANGASGCPPRPP